MTLQYAALLRLPGKMSYELKMSRIKELVDAMQLNACLDTSQFNRMLFRHNTLNAKAFHNSAQI